MTIFTETDTPLGRLLLVADCGELIGLYFAGEKHAPEPAADWKNDPRAETFAAVELQLREYAAGQRYEFEVPLRLQGSAFQRAVWERIQAIPYGETVTYRELAASAGAPRAIRAAAAATGRNPVSLIVPCHRVIGSDGSLTGYAGGLERKRALLRLESHARERRWDAPVLTSAQLG